MDAETIKTLIEILTATAALCAAIASLVSAVKSSKAKDEAEAAKVIVETIQTEIRTNVVATLNTVMRQTQAVQQTQHFSINVGAGTAAQGLAANTPILEQGSTVQGRPLEAGPDQQQEGRSD
jgi:hypothetical protein